MKYATKIYRRLRELGTPKKEALRVLDLAEYHYLIEFAEHARLDPQTAAEALLEVI